MNSGWEIYSTVRCGYDGVMYGIKPNGDMHWFRHQGWREGTNAWAGGPSGIKVGTGSNGDLQWYRHDGWEDGSGAWTASGLIA